MLQSINHPICRFYNFHIKNVHTFLIVKPKEARDLQPRIMTKMVACDDKNILLQKMCLQNVPESPLVFFFSLPCKMLGWVDDYMSWNHIEICHFAATYRHSSWFPNTWKLRRQIAPQTSIPSGCVHSRGASLFGHCGPGRQGRHLVSTKPPPCLPGGWSLPDEEVSRGLKERHTNQCIQGENHKSLHTV